MGNLTSTLTISLKDDVSGKAGAAAGALKKLGASGDALKKLAKSSPEAAKLAKDLEKLEATANKVGALKGAAAGADALGAKLRKARDEVDRTGRALAAAEKRSAFFARSKANGSSNYGAFVASGLVAEADARLKAARTAHVAAQKTVTATATAFGEQKQFVAGLTAGLAAGGVNVKNLGAAEAALKSQIAGVNAELARQPKLLASAAGAAANLTRGMAGVGRQQMQAIENSRRLIDGMGTQAPATRERRTLLSAEAREGRLNAARTLGGMAGVYAGHKVNEATSATLHTYRDFDKYKRQTQAFGNFNDAEMAKIVDMAIHGGASTRYNDIQWLQGAKALGGRGVKAPSVMGILPEAAQYGQAMSVDLPEAVAGLEGSLFAFRRDLSTPEAAMAAARRTADLQVTAAKAFGLTHHDLKGGYEFGALGADMSGLGEEKLLAFLGLGKKLNIEGAAQGNAWRAMVSDLLAPTAKAREAMAGYGIDYSKRQQMPERLSVDNFASMVAQQYGVKLDGKARGKLETAFTDKQVFSDASAFAVAVKGALKGQVGVTDAKAANKVTKSAERFRQTNVEQVDANGLLDDIMAAIKGGNLALATAIFGEKQASRVMAAIRDGDVWAESLKKIQAAPDGKARSVADIMNAGFDGMAARFEGTIKNLETAMGRAWDDDGKGGFLTDLAQAAAGATQALAELPRPVLQAGSLAAYAGGKIATASGTLALIGAAWSLKGSAAAITLAAGRLGVGGAVASAAGATAAGAGAGTAAGAGIGAATATAATATILGTGAITGAILDGAMPGAISGSESFGDGVKRAADKQRRAEAGAATARSLGYANPSKGVSMLSGASAGGGYPTSWVQSRGMIGDFLYGKEKVTQSLPVPQSMRGAAPKVDPTSAGGSALAGPITVSGDLTGTATVSGETTVTVVVRASSELLAVVDGARQTQAALQGQLAAVGQLRSQAGASAGAKPAPPTGVARRTLANSFA